LAYGEGENESSVVVGYDSSGRSGASGGSEMGDKGELEQLPRGLRRAWGDRLLVTGKGSVGQGGRTH